MTSPVTTANNFAFPTYTDYTPIPTFIQNALDTSSPPCGNFKQKARAREMKPSPTNFLDLDDPGSTVGMDVDDADPSDILSGGMGDNKLADSDFFNSFEDDFDDSDVS